jgi:chromosome segregation ATPase
MVQERDSLRQELADMRKSLESIQAQHTKDMERSRAQAEDEKTAKHKAELDDLRNSLKNVQDKHQQELDTLTKQAEDARITKDNAAVAELHASIESMQKSHQQELQDLKDQAQHAQSQRDNAEVAELRQSISSMQEKHTAEIEDLKKQADAAQSTKDNLEITELRLSLESRTAEYQKQVEHLTKGAQEAQEAHSTKENAEIVELRKSLESLREEHQKEVEEHKKEVEELKKQAQEAQADKQSSDGEEVEQLRTQLQDTQKGKENAESAYRTLLGKVNTIKSQLGERLKADAEELSKARAEIEYLQEESKSARESTEELQATLNRLETQRKEHESEIESLRSRTNVSQSNWVKERDDLISKEAFAREEFENARQAMQDWEVLAMEERSLRESLSERVAEIEEQLNAQREAYDRAASERDTQNSTVDSLQRALQDIQDARRKELREMVETSQAQLDALRAQTEEAKTKAAVAVEELEKTRKELEHALPFEKEVKEKNLLIGKLRHEAVILNDHLTKALRFLKRGKPEDNVDRHIVTNHFLHFLMLDRSDPKKFQILQLIAALLGWTEGMFSPALTFPPLPAPIANTYLTEQREQAGLARPGASNSLLKIPLSPFRRTPSTPSLSDATFDNHQGGSKESLAELWSDFLEQEAQEGGMHSSRSGSFAMMSPTQERPASSGGLSFGSPRP